MRKESLAPLISAILRIGVVVSLSVIAAGTVLLFVQNPSYRDISGSEKYQSFTGTGTGTGTAFPHTWGGLTHALAQGSGEGVILLGLLILLATPIVRVAVSFAGYSVQHDRRMAAVTGIVLFTLMGSLIAAGVR